MTAIRPRSDVGRASALLISGTVGAGKTTAAEAVGAWLAERGVPHAVVDLDQLRRCWPAPHHDPFHHAVEVRNLRAVARTYREAGAVRLVLAGVVETASARTEYEDALGVPLVVCRLRVDPAVARARLVRRHEGEDDVLDWHLARCRELDAILATADLEDAVLEVTGLSVDQVAVALVRAAGWDGRSPDGARNDGA